MTDESYFQNHFRDSTITNFVQANLVNLIPRPPIKPMEIPLPPKILIGRDSIVDEISRGFADGTHNPVVVTGPSGVGKSALAAKVAKQSVDQFPDGQVLIDLEDEDALPALRSALLRLGVAKDQLPDSFGGLRANLRSVTSGKAMLFIVDGAGDARDGLDFAPASEHSALAIFALKSTVDKMVPHIPLSEMSVEEAVRMLGLSIEIDGLPAGTVLEMVHLYGTRPSTISRLAGLIRARGNDRTPTIDVIRDLVESPTPDLLGATYRTLSVSGAWLYQFLSVLPGTEFEESLLELFDTPQQSGSDVLEELINARLITRPREGWCLVEPAVTRDSAARGLTEKLPIQLVTSLRDSIRWYVKRAQLADRWVMKERLRRAPMPNVPAENFTSETKALDWLRANHVTLLTAVRMAALQGWTDEAWALAEAMWALYTNVPYPEEAEQCYTAAVDATRTPLDRARMLLCLGRVRLDLGRFAESEHNLRESQALAEAGGDLELVSSAVSQLGRVEYWQGRLDPAIARFEEAERLANSHGTSRAAAIQLMYLGRVHRDRGDIHKGLEYFKHAQDAFLAIGDVRHVVIVESHMATTGAAQGIPHAVEAADRSIGWLRKGGISRHEAEAQERLGAILEGAEGRRRLEAALEIHERIGNLAQARRLRRLLE
ncbi:tetratricopeptide repeat protein [Glycomyces sp. NPDC046736]|uniref:tetratricopeptide repeat protein n=1 Tax=Glycomyces sp. NPDC046736 TaxID=3155615 RepID=UPI003405DC5A